MSPAEAGQIYFEVVSRKFAQRIYYCSQVTRITS